MVWSHTVRTVACRVVARDTKAPHTVTARARRMACGEVSSGVTYAARKGPTMDRRVARRANHSLIVSARCSRASFCSGAPPAAAANARGSSRSKISLVALARTTMALCRNVSAALRGCMVSSVMSGVSLRKAVGSCCSSHTSRSVRRKMPTTTSISRNCSSSLSTAFHDDAKSSELPSRHRE